MGRLRSLVIVLAVALALPALAAPVVAWAAPKFPPLSGRVVDNANLLSPAAEQTLTAELAALEQKTGHQVVVATLPDLQGYDIADYGYQLGRAWGVGRADQDDGAILLVAVAERKVRIEVGYGLEPVLTDALSSVIIQRTITPRFKAGDFETGILDGTAAIVAQLGLPPDEAKARVAEAEAQQRAQATADDGVIDLNLPIVLLVFAVFGVITIVRWIRAPRTPYRGPPGWGWVLPMVISGLSQRGSSGGWRSGGGSRWGSGGGGGFSGGGGSFGGGGASGSW